MKTQLLNYRTRKALRKKVVQRHSTPFANARTIGILYTAEDQAKLDAISRFKSILESAGKEVRFLEYRPSKKNLVFSDHPSLTWKEIGFWGNLQSEDAYEFVGTPFEYLFVADLTPTPVVRHLLARSRSRCRVGLHSQGNTEYLDLMIEMQGDWSALLETMLDYVKRLS